MTLQTQFVCLLSYKLLLHLYLMTHIFTDEQPFIMEHILLYFYCTFNEPPEVTQYSACGEVSY